MRYDVAGCQDTLRRNDYSRIMRREIPPQKECVDKSALPYSDTDDNKVQSDGAGPCRRPLSGVWTSTVFANEIACYDAWTMAGNGVWA